MNLPAIRAFRKYRRRPFVVVPPWSTDHHDKAIYQRPRPPLFLDGLEIIAWLSVVAFFSAAGFGILLLMGWGQ